MDRSPPNTPGGRRCTSGEAARPLPAARLPTGHPRGRQPIHSPPPRLSPGGGSFYILPRNRDRRLQGPDTNINHSSARPETGGLFRDRLRARRRATPVRGRPNASWPPASGRSSSITRTRQGGSSRGSSPGRLRARRATPAGGDPWSTSDRVRAVARGFRAETVPPVNDSGRNPSARRHRLGGDPRSTVLAKAGSGAPTRLVKSVPADFVDSGHRCGRKERRRTLRARSLTPGHHPDGDPSRNRARQSIPSEHMSQPYFYFRCPA